MLLACLPVADICVAQPFTRTVNHRVAMELPPPDGEPSPLAKADPQQVLFAGVKMDIFDGDLVWTSSVRRVGRLCSGQHCIAFRERQLGRSWASISLQPVSKQATSVSIYRSIVVDAVSPDRLKQALAAINLPTDDPTVFISATRVFAAVPRSRTP